VLGRQIVTPVLYLSNRKDPAVHTKLSSKLALAGAVAATAATAWIGVGVASASPGDPTGGGSVASGAVQPHSGGEHFYTAFLTGGGVTDEYAWDVFNNGTATSSFVPPNGFVGTWTWKSSGQRVKFQQTNGAGCTWHSKKTTTGYNTAAHQRLAVCSGVDYTWYAVKGAPPA
jgi:hypothetical protein